ncbi:MAG: hypothetical protein ACOVRB_12120 [Akkermansiaceae bacterium]
MMTAQELARSARVDAAAPVGLNAALQCLWLSKAGHWDLAHDACQNLPDPIGAWIHAHLHREEGDHANAAYWYQRARKPVPPRSLSIADEWNLLVAALG